LNQWCTPPLRCQVSDCSTLLIMCNVPSTAVLFVYRGESIDCPPGSVYSFYLVKDYNSSGPNNYWYDEAFHIPQSLESHSHSMILLRLWVSKFLCLVFNYYVRPTGQNLSTCLYPLFP
jgi:hypothetical protein